MFPWLFFNSEVLESDLSFTRIDFFNCLIEYVQLENPWVKKTKGVQLYPGLLIWEHYEKADDKNLT